MNTNDTYQRLLEPFPPEMERQLSKGGARLTYIPQAEVIARLNNVLGVDGWSMEVINVWRDPSDMDFVLAHVRLTVKLGIDSSVTTVRDGFGGQKINKNKDKQPVDLGDDYKGAVSDAMKKAATTLGVALYLARDAEALEIEAAQQADLEPEPEFQNEAVWNTFREQASLLSAAAREELNSFWSNYSGGRPKPSPTNNTLEDLEALCGEATRLIMDGKYVADTA